VLQEIRKMTQKTTAGRTTKKSRTEQTSNTQTLALAYVISRRMLGVLQSLFKRKEHLVHLATTSLKICAEDCVK